jgi:DNA-binding transcriptional LysR family regulator
MDLIIFARVASTGSFVEAAKALDLPKSTVSRRIQQLEALLGEKVLQRTTRRVVLTEMGQRILGSSEQIQHEIERVVDLADHRKTIPSGQLRVSAPGDLASISLAPMLAAFSIAYPEVQLDLDMSPRYVDLIAESYDLAIRIGDVESDHRLTTRKLIELEIGLFASPLYLSRAQSPSTPQHLSHCAKLVLATGGNPVIWRLQKAGETFLVDPRTRRVAANSYEMLHRFALMGAGIAILPTAFAAQDVLSGALVRILPDWAMQPAAVRAVFPSRRLMPLKSRVFLDTLLAYLKPGFPRDPAVTAAYGQLPDRWGDGALPL